MAKKDSSSTAKQRCSTAEKGGLYPRGVKLAVKILKEIRAIGYKEFSLREYERRQEGQKPGKPQRDIVGECIKKASGDPEVLAGFTSLLTDYLMGVMEAGPIDLEMYDDLDAYMNVREHLPAIRKEAAHG